MLWYGIEILLYDLFKLLNYCNYMYKYDELKRKEKNNKNWVFFLK